MIYHARDRTYESLEAIGKGGMGKAILAKDSVTSEVVVLKKIICNGAAQRKWARDEAQILQKLNHPNIIKYKNSFEHNDEYIIVQEFADAQDLHKYLLENPDRRLSEDDILRIFSQIMLGLQYCHSPGVRVLHRDIKAQNIFLFNNGLVKLGDFGVSKQLDESSIAVTFVGTAPFMSPELVSGHAYGFPTDIWSAGVLLYQLMTGRLPFAGSREDIYGKIRNVGSGVNLKNVPTEYSEALRDLLGKLLLKDPKKRPTADQIIKMKIIQKGLKITEEKLGKKVTRKTKDDSSKKLTEDKVEQDDIPRWIIDGIPELAEQANAQMDKDAKACIDFVRMSCMNLKVSEDVLPVGRITKDLRKRRENLIKIVKEKLGDENYMKAHDFVERNFMENRDELPALLGLPEVPEAEMKLIDAIVMMERYK